MTETLVFLQILVAVATLAVMLYMLYRMVALTAESREARVRVEAATLRAEAGVVAMAANVQKIELATNSMKDQLVLATATSSRLEGREEMRAEEDAKRK